VDGDHESLERSDATLLALSTTHAAMLALGLAACGRIGYEQRPGGGDDVDASAEAGAPLPPSDAAPARALVYANSPNTLYRIDPVTLAVTVVAPFSGPCATEPMTDIAIDKTGVMIGVTFNNVFRIDADTASCEFLAPLPRMFNGLSFVPSPTNPDVDILIGTTVQGEIWQLDPVTGTTIKYARYGNGVSSAGDLVAVRGAGTYAAVRFMSDVTDYLATVDVLTGNITVIGDTNFIDVYGMGYWNNQVYGFTSSSEFILINLTTGRGTLREQSTVQWYGAGVTTIADVTAAQ
jgi:hypothetical protein